MIISCGNSKNLCEDFDCKIEKTEKGITISLEGDNPEKVEALQNMVESCKTLCCDSDKKESCC